MSGKSERFLADITKSFPRSPIRAMFDEAQKLSREGKELVRLEIGEPDFNTPREIKQGAIEAIEDNKTHYTENAGVFELREEVSKKLFEENDMDVDPETQIVTTAGAMEALYLSMLITLSKGEKILIPDPGWPNYKNQVIMSSARPDRYELKPESDYQIDLEDLKEKIEEDTKGLLINTPSNPLGTILDKDTLNGIADIAEDEDILIYSDEAYEKLVYEDNEHISIGSIDRIKDQVLTIQSFSKSYAMTGWRVGYVTGDEGMIKEIEKARESSSACTSSVSQEAAIRALREGGDSVERMRSIYEERKNLLMEYVEEMPLAHCEEPQGAFYAFLDVSEVSEPSLKIAKDLLHEKGVVTVPGSGFGELGEGFLRLSFATDKESISKGLERISSFLKERS